MKHSMRALLQGEALASRDVMLFFLLHGSEIMQPLVKPAVGHYLRTYQDLVDTLSHKADGFL